MNLGGNYDALAVTRQTVCQRFVNTATDASSIEKVMPSSTAVRMSLSAADLAPPFASPKRPLLPPPSPITLQITPDLPRRT
jgi:hypothetical protein